MKLLDQTEAYFNLTDFFGFLIQSSLFYQMEIDRWKEICQRSIFWNS